MRVSEEVTRVLVLGGCRSGKSKYSEQWAREGFDRKVLIATLDIGTDEEMRRRVQLHRQSRGAGWVTVEQPVDVAGAVMAHQQDTDVILIDCLTLWITNLMLQNMSDEEIEHEVEQLVTVVGSSQSSVVLVANEVGLGIVPESAMGRRFRDLAGWTNQQFGAMCDQVVFMAAGIPQFLK
ncbi:bifunctional adenosylcobinamide kinase/adenosylcobinamide-phosphate guanylyltransferase [Thermodesulfobacteriota bacterium]